MPKPKILLLIPNLGPGGAQKVFHQQLQLLSERYETIGCVFNWNGSFDSDHKPNIISLDVPGGKNFISKAYQFFRRVARVMNIKKTMRVDLCISHLEGADYVNVLSRGNEKTLLWIHGSKRTDAEISGLTGILRKKIMLPVLYRQSDAIACVSDGIRLELLKEGISPSRLSVVQNGFDVASINREAGHAPSHAFELFRSGKFTIVTHSRFSPQKNLGALISIVDRFKNEDKIAWVIIGDGEERETILRQCDDRGIGYESPWRNSSSEARIFFTGYLDNPFPLLKKSDLYVLLSRWEGFPLALCEALACGLTVVSSDSETGPREILNLRPADEPVRECTYGDYGVLLPVIERPDDKEMIDRWVECLRAVIGDDLLRKTYAEKSAQALERFSLASTQRKTLALIEGLLGDNFRTNTASGL